MDKWTKQCKCGNFIPTPYEMCDTCLLAEYGLLEKIREDDSGYETLKVEDIISILRILDKRALR
jgi:hypothetical protein